MGLVVELVHHLFTQCLLLLSFAPFVGHEREISETVPDPSHEDLGAARY